MPPTAKPPSRLSPAARLRAYFLAGLLVTTPFILTAYLAWAVIAWVDDRVMPLLPAAYNPATYLPFAVPGIGLLIVLAGLTMIGALAAGLVGRLLVGIVERILARTPVLRSVYGATKQIIATVLTQQSQSFREVVLVEFPRKGSWSLAFITGTPGAEIQAAGNGDLVAVFVPTTPNPTSGYLIFVERSEVVPTRMSVEDGLKMVVSCGIVAPADPGASAASHPDLR